MVRKTKRISVKRLTNGDTVFKFLGNVIVRKRGYVDDHEALERLLNAAADLSSNDWVLFKDLVDFT